MIKQRGTLYRAVAPHYVAGFVLHNGRVITAAPILRWLVGKDEFDVIAYFLKKRYELYHFDNKKRVVRDC